MAVVQAVCVHAIAPNKLAATLLSSVPLGLVTNASVALGPTSGLKQVGEHTC